MSGPTFLTRAEVAERLRCSEHLVSRMVGDGRLRAHKRGGYRQSRVLIEAASVDEHLERTRLIAARRDDDIGPCREDVESALVDAEAALDRLRGLVAGGAR